MDLMEAMEKRHAVRSYDETKGVEGEAKEKLEACISECNKESGLHIQLVTDEPKAFGGMMARYGKFSGVENYIAMVGKKGPDLEEKCGYYGEKIALFAQTLGLNTCWVVLTYSKVRGAYTVGSGEDLCIVLPIGYGKTQGVPHRSKPKEDFMKGVDDPPEWFLLSLVLGGR